MLIQGGIRLSNKEVALIKKDIKEVFSSKQIYLPMIIVPMIMVVIMPSIILISVNFSKDTSSLIKDMKGLLEILPLGYGELSIEQRIIKASIDYIFPAFFLLIPIMCSSIIGASSFVGEREHKTLETLFYTPMSLKELFRGKVFGVFIPSYCITILSFLAFGIVVNLGGWKYFGRIIFPDMKWTILILYLVPAITLLGLTFTVLVSAKSKTFQEAQQVSGLIVLPIILLIVGQITGVFLLTNTILLILGAIIYIIDYILFDKITKSFIYEKLV